MTWSNASTNRRAAQAWLCLAVLGAMVLGGCAQKPPPAPPLIHGSVNLDQLVRRHPGWSGVSQYDAALRRLEQAAASLPQGGRPDQKMAILPALASEALPSAATPPAEVTRIGKRLDAVQLSLQDGLQARRAAARRDAVRQQQDVWRREARGRFVLSPEAAAGAPDLELQLLQANVETLTRTAANWKQSLPPAPRLEDLQAKVTAERAKLKTLLAERAQQRLAAQTRRQRERQQVREDRLAYVQQQADALEAQLRSDDAQLAAAQSARLTQQRAALLAALAQSPAGSVPPAGFAGAETLPHGPGVAQASLSQVSLTASEARLRNQRARWVKFLYDDTQAAALDTAGRHGWNVTFGPPRAGDRDLTAAMTQAMQSTVWRL